MATRNRFPSAKALAAGPVVVQCADVRELAKAGLQDHELYIEHIWYDPDEEEMGDEDYEPTLWPSWLFRIRRVGTKRWHTIGIADDGYNFKHCAGCGTALMRYFGDLEEVRGHRVADLTYNDDNGSNSNED